MLMAALTGLNIPIKARARFRLSRKKFTARVRGTIPISSGWLMARPKTANTKNCQTVVTPPRA